MTDGHFLPITPTATDANCFTGLCIGLQSDSALSGEKSNSKREPTPLGSDRGNDALQYMTLRTNKEQSRPARHKSCYKRDEVEDYDWI
jgi:hypothetical protein